LRRFAAELPAAAYQNFIGQFCRTTFSAGFTVTHI
jgi:hypothetical protein